MATSDVKYELIMDDPDEMMSSPVYNFLSKWGIIILLLILILTILFCSFIRIPVTYEGVVSMKRKESVLNGNIKLSEDMAFRVMPHMPVDVTFRKLNSKEEYVLSGEVDSTYFDNISNSYFTHITLSDLHPGISEIDGVISQPGKVVIVLDHQSIISAILKNRNK